MRRLASRRTTVFAAALFLGIITAAPAAGPRPDSSTRARLAPSAIARPRGKAIGASRSENRPPLQTGSNVVWAEPAASRQQAEEPPGIQLTVSSVDPVEPPPPRTAKAPVTAPLDDRTTRALLGRLPPIAELKSDETTFLLHASPNKPPRTGTTIVDAFPPAPPIATRPEAPSPPPTVLARAPVGQVAEASRVSITFSQPMVAIATDGQLSAQEVPARLAPQPPGSWRWVGTQTLLFQGTGPFPMATNYVVEIPAGALSAAGTAFADGARWTFSTPPVSVVDHYPESATGNLDPLLFVRTNQRVDPSAVLDVTRMRAGGLEFALRLATESEVAADPAVAERVEAAADGHWLVFRADRPLPKDTDVTITIGPLLRSLEGPRPTTDPFSWTFHTRRPMTLSSENCYETGTVVGDPNRVLDVFFTNPIDQRAFAPDMVTLTPATVTPEVRVAPFPPEGRAIEVSGRFPAGEYRLTFSRRLQDVFGQTLGHDASLTCTVLPRAPFLAALGGHLTVLDPATRRFPIYSTGYRAASVRIYAVQPDDWPAFSRLGSDEGQSTTPGRLVSSSVITLRPSPEETIETLVDLAPALTEGVGQLILDVNPHQFEPRPSTTVTVTPMLPQRALVWIQATRIGLDVFADSQKMIVLATSLVDGLPTPGVSLALGGLAATTGRDGMATLAGAGPATAEVPLVARLGADIAWLRPDVARYPQDRYATGRRWGPAPTDDRPRWFVFDDRRLYRPGETVHVKGWVRVMEGRLGGDVVSPGATIRTVSYALTDASRGSVAQGTGSVNAHGGFDFAVTLPTGMALGRAQFTLQITDGDRWLGEAGSYPHVVMVEEFRRPAFEVVTSVDGPTHGVGHQAIVSAKATYYAGGSVPDAPIEWFVHSERAFFVPPNRRDFTFGHWVPWWESGSRDAAWTARPLEARTTAAGMHAIRIAVEAVSPPAPVTIHATASVLDVDRQEVAAQSVLLVHPAALYVGLKTERYFVTRGTPLEVDIIVTAIDGRAESGRDVTLRAERTEWRLKKGEWQQTVLDPQECRITSRTEAVRCAFRTTHGGSYDITATVTDADGRRNETRITRWVAGGRLRIAGRVEKEGVLLVPDKEEYRPGEAATILVVPPFTPAEGVLTLRRSGIVRTERFRVEGESHTVRIPIEEGWLPNIVVQVDLVGAQVRTGPGGDPAPDLPRRPAFASGSLDLRIPADSRRLTVVAEPRAATLTAGGETMLDLTVRDARGQPVSNGELAIAVVDEAVLAMAGFRLPDPVAAIYGRREPEVSVRHLRSLVLMPSRADLQAALDTREFVQTQTAYVQTTTMTPEPPRVRADFSPLALFVPGVLTNERGQATVPLKLPDTLTRYRVIALAATAGAEFGASAEATITAQLPLMARLSAPRFLNVGDRFELPVIVQNATDRPLTAKVVLRASRATLIAGGGRLVTVPAHDRADVRFPALVNAPGVSRFQAMATTDTLSDATEVSVPVWTPATTEAFAASGHLDEGATAQRLRVPRRVFANHGGLSITTSSTALHALTDAVLYLATYPYSCTEQLSSRILAVAALRDVLAAFKAPGLPDAGALEKAVEEDLREVISRLDDKGFGLWRRSELVMPYTTVHAVHALERAAAHGFPVPKDALERGRDLLERIEETIPEKYHAQTRRAIIAYALHVRALGGDRDTARARRLVQEAGRLSGLSFETVGWLLSVLSGDEAFATQVAALRRHISNHVTETAATASVASSYGDDGYLLFEGPRRADAVVLDALIADQPQSDLITKIVEGLLAHRRAGRWDSTQENAFVLLALHRYFTTYEKATPDFVARVWLGNRYAGDHAFAGRTTERHTIEVPMKALAAVSSPTTVVLAKDGPGRLYYRLGLQYAPVDLVVPALNRGFTITRTYEAADDRGDVRRDPDGTWHVRAGARVRVKVTMTAPGPRYHVALVDPLPAGFEPLNPALATTGEIPPDDDDDEESERRPWSWYRSWYEHQNLRDDRAEAFTSLLWSGTYTYSYVARATTIGHFTAPPTKAEEMYSPETFGRGATDRIVVEIDVDGAVVR